MRPVVFLGPSGHGVPSEALGGLDIRPPARRGDIIGAAKSRATAIGLVDGLFETTRSVWHKEILFALSEGVAVFGAASMGALRAAECADFGMRGVGQIFADYAEGRRFADADVAVAHAPAELGWRPLGVALVDAEASFAAMLEADAIDPDVALLLDRAARALHFKDRTWPRMIVEAHLDGEAAHAASLAIARHARSVKREDAALLLETIRIPERRDGEPRFELSRTPALESLLRDAESGVARLG